MERCERCGDPLFHWDTTTQSASRGICKYCYQQHNKNSEGDRMNVYNLIVTKVSNEDEVEVFVTTYATLETALKEQQEAIELEKRERADEELTVDEFINYETAITDENGGYVIFKVQETAVQ